MFNLNEVVGVVLIVAGALAFVVACAIAIKQYVLGFMPKGKGIVPAAGVLKAFFALLKAMLTAPPATAFLVGALLLFSGGIALLHFKPF